MVKSTSKELGGSDLEKLGLSRSFLADISGDDLKKAKSIRENAKKDGREIKIYQNGLGEIGIEEIIDGKSKDLGVINKAGFSLNDVKDVVKDPTNLLFLIPGVGQVGAGIRGLTGLAKLGKLAKNSAKLAGATALTNQAVSTGANLQNNDEAIQEGDLINSAIAGATAPVADIVGHKIAGGIKGIVKQAKAPKVKASAEKAGDFYLPGQLNNDLKTMEQTEAIAKGLKGEKSRKLLEETKDKKIDNVKNKLSNELGVDFNNPSFAQEKAENIKSILEQVQKSDAKAVKDAYSRVNKGEIGVSQVHLEDLIATMKNNLESATELPYQKLQEHAKKHGSKSPYYDAISSINAFEKDLIDAPTNINPPKSIKDVMTNKGGKVEGVATLKDGTPIHFEYGNERIGGKHIAHKHPSALTNDIVQKIEAGDFIMQENGKIKITTKDGMEIIVEARPYKKGMAIGKNSIATAYKKDGSSGIAGAVNDPNSNPAYIFSKDTTTGNMITQNGDNAPINFNDLAYNIKTYNDIETTRTMLNESISSARRAEQNDRVRQLMNVKDALDKFELKMLNSEEPLLLGARENLVNLRQARELNSQYEKKYKDYRTQKKDADSDVVNREVLDFGAKELQDILANPNKGAEDLAKVFKLNNPTKTLGLIRQVRTIAGDSLDDDLKTLFLQDIFTDSSKIGGGAELNINHVLKKITEKIEKNSKLANELFRKEELDNILKNKEILEVMYRQANSNPSGTFFATTKQALSDGILNKLPFVGDIKKALGEYYNQYQTARFLNKKPKATKQPVARQQTPISGATLGALLNSSAGQIFKQQQGD